jgi:branched-subunit amino acid transport protein
MNKHLFTLIFCITFSLTSQAQIGGSHVYEFLNFSPSARVTALGGSLITVQDDDHSLAYDNPALLNKSMHQGIAFNHNFHLAGIQNGYAAYAHHIDKIETTFTVGMQYVDYGDFIGTDEFGNETSGFNANELALTIGAGRKLYDKVSVGANLKLISSTLEAFNSYGISLDLGAYYEDPEKRITAAFVVKNFGTQLSTYREGVRESIPFEIQFGVSKRLENLPFRFSIIAHKLETPNLNYDNPAQVEERLFFGEEPQQQSNFNAWLDNIFKHLIFNGEFLIGKKENFRLRIGYNHFVKKELSVQNFRSLAGFSGGFGFKINRFRLDYGLGVYHLGGSLNHLTISTNIREFRKKRLIE